jgi:hypothetical protein
MGGGGSKSSSSTSQKYNTNIVTKDDLNIMSQNLSSAVSTTIMNAAMKCSASITQLQKVQLTNMNVVGDFNLSAKQGQQAAMTFDCVQVSEIKSAIANNLVTELMNGINGNFTTDVLDKLDANAKSNSASGAGSSMLSGPTSSNSSSNIDYNFNSTTDIHKNIVNVVQNSIVNKLDIKSIQSCIASINQSQIVGATNVNVGGTVFVAVDQVQSSNLLASCLQKSNIGNNIASDVASKLGLTVTEDVSTKKSTTASTSASSTAESRGPAESVGSGISTAAQGTGTGIGNVYTGMGTGLSNVFGGFGSMFSSGGESGGTNWGLIIFSIICCIMILIIGGGGLYLYMNGDIPKHKGGSFSFKK